MRKFNSISIDIFTDTMNMSCSPDSDGLDSWHYLLILQTCFNVHKQSSTDLHRRPSGQFRNAFSHKISWQAFPKYEIFWLVCSCQVSAWQAWFLEIVPISLTLARLFGSLSCKQGFVAQFRVLLPPRPSRTSMVCFNLVTRYCLEPRRGSNRLRLSDEDEKISCTDRIADIIFSEIIATSDIKEIAVISSNTRKEFLSSLKCGDVGLIIARS